MIEQGMKSKFVTTREAFATLDNDLGDADAERGRR
jgi:hypothetical protein